MLQMRGLAKGGEGMKLQGYDPKRKCPKCSHDDIWTIYHKSGRSGYACWHWNEEHLCRHCRRCGYNWCERILVEGGEDESTREN